MCTDQDLLISGSRKASLLVPYVANPAIQAISRVSNDIGGNKWLTPVIEAMDNVRSAVTSVVSWSVTDPLPEALDCNSAETI